MPKKTKTKKIPAIPEPFLTRLINSQNECKSLAKTNQELKHQIGLNELQIKRTTQFINQDSFDALIRSGLDPRDYVTDLDLFKFKLR